MHAIKNLLRAILPERIISFYHLFLAEFAAFWFRYPSHGMLVIGVTGTKGKSSVTEMVSAILEAAKYRTAIINSIRFKIGEESVPNTTRMSMPGRFFLQRFMYRAYRDQCDAVVIEMTSEGARQHRHRGIALDALIFTNLAPEHIESHGSLQAYKDAKFSIGEALARSKKHVRYMVANADDAESARYLALSVEQSLPFSLATNAPWEASPEGGYFTLDGEKIAIDLPGEFSLKNALAAATLARALEVKPAVIAEGLKRVQRIPGRGERIDAGQDFAVVVDYAHTPDSLKAIYEAYGSRHKICVLGATGGGRDKWKRPVMASITDAHCDTIILTDEDPYDEDPRAIVDELASGMKKHAPEIIMDRRAAIARGIALALSWSKGSPESPFDRTQGNNDGVAVIITGKGTDPNIARAHGTKEPWSDAQVARDELEKARGAI